MLTPITNLIVIVTVCLTAFFSGITGALVPENGHVVTTPASVTEPAVTEPAVTAEPAPPAETGMLSLLSIMQTNPAAQPAAEPTAAPAGSASGYSVIERGHSGEAVENLQNRLTELGYYTGKITGKMDSATQLAYKKFEKANGFTANGVASAEEQEVLFSELAVPAK